MDILCFPMQLIVQFPWIAFIIAAVFLGAWFWYWIITRSRIERVDQLLLLVCGVFWLGYGPYEIMMYYWAQKVAASIRVDLLLIAPLMYAVTIAGVYGAVSCLRRMRKGTGHAPQR